MKLKCCTLHFLLPPSFQSTKNYCLFFSVRAGFCVCVLDEEEWYV